MYVIRTKLYFLYLLMLKGATNSKWDASTSSMLTERNATDNWSGQLRASKWEQLYSQ